MRINNVEEPYVKLKSLRIVKVYYHEHHDTIRWKM